MPAFSRRTLLAVSAVPLASALLGHGARGQDSEVTREMILNDPAVPVGGNPKGDLTIVAYLDYNCPYCKKTAPILDRIVKEDGRIRLVYKDWPVIRPTSIDGATLAIAANFQGKYEAAHHALMSIPGSNVSRDAMSKALQAAGIDMSRLDADMAARAGEIDALIKRNMAQGDALDLTGTPTFLVGPFRTSTLDAQGFKQVIKDARAHRAEPR
ncbi:MULTISPECIES: DsbA family protein [unclassified Chelatococcus]|uniref:DsbA family protein n=1 Tax=unclassified Chelatococcus TaxID=2638111 RepID=UPI001BCEE5AE|nr:MULTISPECIES: DsbA family protein [unclassified Chelatococcus]MBS7700078.1 DsbA family protein [Chelatococcus sp. YT9]MBX3556771.1 DsbA family protein [Chelatococcus sp.]